MSTTTATYADVLGAHKITVPDHPSLTGIDADDSPDKVWRCHVCDGLFRMVTSEGITRTVPADDVR